TTTQASSSDRSVEAVLSRFVPRLNRDNPIKVFGLRLMFGIPTVVTPDGEDEVVTNTSWPTLSELGKQVGAGAAQVSQAIDQAARRWGNTLAEAPGEPYEELRTWLASSGGVGTLDEAAHLMLAAHGSTAEGPARLRLAAGL